MIVGDADMREREEHRVNAVEDKGDEIEASDSSAGTGIGDAMSEGECRGRMRRGEQIREGILGYRRPPS